MKYLHVLALAALCSAAATQPNTGQEPHLAPATGTVVDEHGSPIEGVRYWVSGNEERQADGRWQLVHFTGLPRMRFTGADGRFEIDSRERLRSDVDFDRAGFAPMTTLALEPGMDRRVAMVRGHDLEGRVVQRFMDAGGSTTVPVEFAEITLRRPNARGLWFETNLHSDHSGMFRFDRFLPPIPADGEVPASDFDRFQLVCGGALFELPAAVDEAVRDVVIEISIRRGE